MTLTPNLRRQRLRNLLVKLGNDRDLLKTYLSRLDREGAAELATDPRLVAAVLAERDAALAARADGPRSPLYQAPLVCPAHPGGEASPSFKGWFSLGHQRVEENLFGVPRSLGGLDGYAAIDAVLLEAQVCPACRYASPFRQDFGKPGQPAPQRDPAVLAALSSPAARAARAGVAGPKDAAAYADPGRGSDVARAAFVLALASARTAREAGEPAAPFKEAYVRLRLARLDEDAGRRAGARAHYEEALQASLAYHSVDLPHERLASISRQIVLLAVHLGQDDLASRHRSALFDARTRATRRMEDLEHETAAARRANPEALPGPLARQGEEAARILAAYTKHFARADEAWQDRDLNRFKDD